MATATIPNSFTNGTNADANLVNANFSYLSSWLNTNVIQPNVANFSVFPTLPSSNPTSDYQAAHKSYVDLFMPAGIITQYVGTAAPSGWRLCDGTLYNGADATYARLWAALGTTYGGSGINSFAVPDLKGRVPVGYGAGAGLTTRSLNDKAGSETHLLTGAESGTSIHTHPATGTGNQSADHTHAQLVGLITYANGANQAVVTTNLGGANGLDPAYSTGVNSGTHQHTTNTISASANANASAAHNNMPPFVVVSYIIKL